MTAPDRAAHERPRVSDNVRLRTHSSSALLFEHPEWPALPPEAKVSLLREQEPQSEQSTHNVTCVGLYDYLVDAIDPFTRLSDTLRDISHMAVGDNAAGGVAKADTALNNEVYRAEVTAVAQSAGTATFTVLLDAGEANGFTIRELGLTNGDTGDTGWVLCNHATVADEAKTVNKTMTFDVSLTFDDEVA